MRDRSIGCLAQESRLIDRREEGRENSLPEVRLWEKSEEIKHTCTLVLTHKIQ